MILDARLDTVRLDRSTQIVIVGAGPAGLTLARELTGLADIVVVEGGGLHDDAEQQALLAGDCAGLPYPLTETRARQFGGSSSLWAGYCAQFDEHDFLVRDWIPHSGWPFPVEGLEPYYARAAALLNVEDYALEPAHIAECTGLRLPFDERRFVHTFWRFGTPTARFGESLLTEFETSREITVLVHANVADIRLSPGGGSAEEVIVRTLNGRQGRVSFDLCILACGGLETPRLLLNANSQMSCGVGNSNGMVGRCFMEHPHMPIASLEVRDRDLLEWWARRNTCGGNIQFAPCLGLSSQLQQDARVANGRVHVYRTPSMSLDDAPRVGLFMEQVPNLDSRVLLSDATDRIGLRRLRLDWRLSESDWQSFETSGRLVAEEFERVSAARLVSPVAVTRDPASVLHSNHQLGTTRMSSNREDGVVNTDCRTHDMSNLYIIGGSIFPTVSWANPTFTVMSLALRLAEHLKRLIGGLELV